MLGVATAPTTRSASQGQLDAIAGSLNTGPRRALEFMTLGETFAEAVAATT